MLFYYLSFLLEYLLAQCNKQLCSLSDSPTLSYQFLDNFDSGILFWYKYHVEVQTQSKIIIFQESIDRETTPDFSYIIALNDSIVSHELESVNVTVWDQQLVVPLAEDEYFWHLVFFYKDDSFMHIQIQVGQNLYHGLNKYSLAPLVGFKFNNPHPNIYVMICAKEFVDKSMFPKIKDSLCNDDLTADLQLSYYWDLNVMRSQSFNVNKAIISGWFRDQQQESQFSLTIQQFSSHQLFDLILSINKQGHQLAINTFGWDSSSNFKNVTVNQTQALLSWYYIELNPFSHFKLHTLSEAHSTEILIIKTYPTANVQIKVIETIFANLTASANIRYACSPACEQCSSIMICTKCKSNRILPNCECPQGLHDFGEIDCLRKYNFNQVQNHQGLTLINTMDENCPVGFQQCGQQVICDHGYIQFNKKCYECPKLGEEICQYCVISSMTNEPRFFCQYTSNDNLLRFKEHRYDEYMIFFHQNIVHDFETQYFKLDLASVTINYQIEENKITKIQGYQPKYFNEMNKGDINYQCPYGYQKFIPIYSSHFKIEFACQKIPKGCLKIESISSDVQCKVCKPSYSLIDNFCQKCPKNCLSCNQNYCTSCIKQYYQALDGRCKPCRIQNCKICYEFKDGDLSLNDDLNYNDVDAYCALCEELYQFNYQTLKCELQQINGCQVAIYNQTHQCLVFQHSQSDVLSSSCQQKECSQCFQNRCLVCIPGYYLQNSLCKSCRFSWMNDFYNDYTFFGFDLDCQLIDPFNHSEFKNNLQHIFLLHQQEQASLLPLQIRFNKCLSFPIIYDIFYCQMNDNQFIHNESQLCKKYFIAEYNYHYCIQQNSFQDGLVIDRKTGKVKYCDGYKACLIKFIYEVIILQSQIDSKPKKFIEYKNMTYQDINEFVQSINYESLIKQEVDHVEIIFNVNRSELSVIQTQEQTLPINLILNIEYPKSEEINDGISELLLSKFNQIIIERFDGQYKNSIVCNSLKITWFIFGHRTYDNQLQLYDNQLQVFARQSLISAKYVNLSYVTITSFEIKNQQNFITFDQTAKLTITQLIITQFQCENSFLFQFTNPPTYYKIIIDELRISKSSFKSCMFLKFFKSQFFGVQIKNITIDSTTFINVNFFEFWSLISENIVLTNSQITNSIIFQIYINNSIDRFYFATSTLDDSTLIMNSQISEIKIFQSASITSIYSQLIYFRGQLLNINALYILDTYENSPNNFKVSLIFIESDVCILSAVNFQAWNGNIALLHIKAKNIKISSVIIMDNGLSIAQVNDQCQIILSKQQPKLYLILEEFNHLELNNSFVGNVQSNVQLIQITSSLVSKVIIYNATFNDIYLFNTKLILIDCQEVNLSMIILNRIWFHDLIYNPLSTYMIVFINSISADVKDCYFIGIKNINSNQFRYIYIQSVNLNVNTIFFIQQNYTLSQYVQNELNQQQREYLDNSFGNSQLMFIISRDLIIQGLIIRSIPKSTQYLIHIDNNTPIFRLLFNNWTVTMGGSRNPYYLGLVLASQIIQQGAFTNILCVNIQVLKNIFEVAINNSLIIQNFAIRNLLQGSVLHCQLINNQSSLNIYNVTIITKRSPNAKIYQTPILFTIINGNIAIKQIVFRKQLANAFDIQKAYSISLKHIYVSFMQPMSTLILINSVNCEYLEISNVTISDIQIYQPDIYKLTFLDQANVQYERHMCWNGSLAKDSLSSQINLQPLVILNIQISKETNLIFKNIQIKSSKNIENLLIMPNRMYILEAISLIDNVCEYCIKLQDNLNYQRMLQTSIKYQLNFTKCDFIQNQGVLFDFQNSILTLNSSQIIHKTTLQTASQQNTNEFIFRSSNILYNSFYQFHSQFVLIDSYLINQQNIHILNTNAIQIGLSLDDGFRTYPSINNSIVFNDKMGQKYDYFNFPTGQQLGNYQRISLKHLEYRDFIQNMRFVLLSRQRLSNSKCSFQYQNQEIYFDFDHQDWKNLTIIDKPGSTINLTTKCDQITLKFKVKLLHCQIGEIFLNNSCLRCNSTKDQYQVKKYASNCITKTANMKSVQSGLIELEPGYWRPHYFNDQVEACQPERCQGGWDVGDKSCQIGYMGALCSECDLYQLRGSGKYIKNSINNCTICETNKSDLVLVVILILFNCILLFKNVLSWQDNCIQRRNTQLFQKQFQILQKFQVDQISIIAFLFNNFIQIFLMINQSNLELPLLLKSILITYSNPNISLQEEFKCILSQYISQENLIVGKPLIFILLQIFFFNFFLCLFMIFIKKYKLKTLLIILYYIVLPDYSNYFEILLQQSTWSEISGIKWMTAHQAFRFNNDNQQMNLYFIILPQIVITFLIIPLTLFKYLSICKIRLGELRIYYKIRYFYSLFKDSQYYELILIIWQKMIILWIVYIFQNKTVPKLLLLLLFLAFFERLNDFLEPFTLHKYNDLSKRLSHQLRINIILFGLLNYCSKSRQQAIIIQFIIILSLIYSLNLFAKYISAYLISLYIFLLEKIHNVQNKLIKQYTSPILDQRISRSQSIKERFDKIKIKNIKSQMLSQRQIQLPKIIINSSQSPISHSLQLAKIVSSIQLTTENIESSLPRQKIQVLQTEQDD